MRVLLLSGAWGLPCHWFLLKELSPSISKGGELAVAPTLCSNAQQNGGVRFVLQGGWRFQLKTNGMV